MDKVALMVHGDDYLCVGADAAPIKFHENISNAFEIKFSHVGHGEGRERGKDASWTGQLAPTMMGW